MISYRPVADAIAPLLILRAIAQKQNMPVALAHIEAVIEAVKADVF